MHEGITDAVRMYATLMNTADVAIAKRNILVSAELCDDSFVCDEHF